MTWADNVTPQNRFPPEITIALPAKGGKQRFRGVVVSPRDAHLYKD
jgi:hypothetical protein